MCGLLAGAEPWWVPGTAFGYHAQTFGFLLGETLQRATGTSLATLLRTTLTEPLGIAEALHFAVPVRLLSRVARQLPAREPPPHLQLTARWPPQCRQGPIQTRPSPTGGTC